jgi:hypothetical protein
MQIFEVIEEAITKPPIPHDPNRQSLKQWAMYCLRDKGFKVVYAQNADFAIETKGSEKLYFKVANNTDNLDNKFGWIVWDSSNKIPTIIPPQVLIG